MLNILVGVVHLAVAATLVGNVRRTAKMFPWMIALAAFFAIRGAERIVHALHEPPALFGQLADTLVVATLLLLLFGLGRTISSLQMSLRAAERQRQEYERALHDYRQLARHRLANPLAAIRGGIETLRDLEGLTTVERKALIEMLHGQAVRLEQLSLDPHPSTPAEASFHAVPLEPSAAAQAWIFAEHGGHSNTASR
jgi:signal transduction histidine kinase